MNKNTKYLYFLAISAIITLSMSAYYSIIGIGMLFAGKRLFASILAGTLEFNKVVITSYLTIKWKNISKAIKFYFILAVIVLICISSAGIYSYLTNAYHITAHNIESVTSDINNINNKIKLLENSKELYERQFNNTDNEISSIRISIKRNDNQLQKLYTATEEDTTGKTWYYNINQLRDANKKYNNQIDELQKNKTISLNKIQIINDSIASLQNQENEKQKSDEFINVGPLGRLSEIFKINMDVIVKYFTFIIILIFDPLGVLLVYSFNKQRIIMSNNSKKDKRSNSVDDNEQEYLQQSINKNATSDEESEDVGEGIEKELYKDKKEEKSKKDDKKDKGSTEPSLG